MPQVEAVLFDYGRTLVTFTYPRDELLAVIERFRPAIAAASGVAAPRAEEIMEKVLLPLESVIENPDETEVTYLDLYADAWRKAGIDIPDELRYEILDAEQQVWDDVAAVDPEARDVLAWLGEHDIKTALCSNAPFPPEMMLRQVERNGIASLVDAIVFSSELGLRKPAPGVYRATLEKLGVDAARSLFVGDRVREDYSGPLAVGMRAVICTAHAAEPPPAGTPTISSLAELPRLL